ncbi:Ni/Fe-hydrogenase, b-type cytochrome subunit [Campylobacter sp.]|uniref:Ni/Fe-hydrogenase, b-type cytochrome subunit n=1 Tax=Campylobacter sp. TaxID=205 RepID=UPI0025C1E9E8|nr:Ni/Fe-hydrogenase, b-type cytochrome subunit [Campylobacter sp.]
MESKHSLKLIRKADYELSIGFRFTHWLRAFAIVILVGTGYYISYVFQSPSISSEPVLFMQAKYRMIHQIFGFILIACIIFKTYLFFFDAKSFGERKSIKDMFDVKLWVEQIKFYIFLGKHPRLQGVYNPLQFVTYLLFYFVICGIILTGLILYMNVYHEGFGGFLYGILKPVEEMLGGLANVRTYHRILMWIVLIFIPIHIYMAVFNAVKGKDGALDAIFSGYKFIRENH